MFTFSAVNAVSVKIKLQYRIVIALLSFSGSFYAQDVNLYQQFNGRYDFLFIGNTLNMFENTGTPCQILTGSAANLTLQTGDVVEKAYLYWAGSGTGDLTVNLNSQNITSQRNFSLIQASNGNPFFSAFADITTLVQTTGNGTYTLSDLDVSAVLPTYCQNATNFAGWAIIVIYQNPALPLNQLNVYDGLQSVPDLLTITLNNLNVIDNAGAKIGFVAWEGDSQLAVNETLSINGNAIGNPPLNPVTNAFNGTNSFTGSNTLFNMDLDVYNIQNNIQIGDTSAEIQLTSGQDFVMINAVVTKLNSQLPDATITIDKIVLECDSRILEIDFTVYNINSTQILPAGTPIAIYINGEFIAYTETLAPIAIEGSAVDNISVVIPAGIPNEFELLFVVDDNGTGNGIVAELIETNNNFSSQVSLWLSPLINPVQNAFGCNLGFGSSLFDLSTFEDLIPVDADDAVDFYHSFSDAENELNPILNTTSYTSAATPEEIFVRIENEHCYTISSFSLIARNCPPIVYNYISPNNDGFNDDFYINGLRNIFLNFKLSVYNRWGRLLWVGDNNSPNWDGMADKGISSDPVPDGTYFYVLELNDPDYPRPMNGYLFFNK